MIKKFWIGLNKKDFSALEVLFMAITGVVVIQFLPGCH